jgi:class 3 adenylate cyclase
MKHFKDLMAEGVQIVGLRPQSIQSIIDEETRLFTEGAKITDRNSIPDTSLIPIENPSAWIRINDVIACFVDMEGSTKLSASTHQNSTAKIYRYFTNTAVLIFHEFEAPYIDVRGDGVFALFNSDKPHTALAATVSFKTFVRKEFTPRVTKLTDMKIGGHYGIDQKTVLVRKLGLKAVDGRSDRQNEVWAGKPINMAAKLASRSKDETIWVSDRFYRNLTGDKARMSCGCQDGVPNCGSNPLWQPVDVSDDPRFDFDEAYVMKSTWCAVHGKSYCRDVVAYDHR